VKSAKETMFKGMAGGLGFDLLGWSRKVNAIFSGDI
jgi:hypothetical protein